MNIESNKNSISGTTGFGWEGNFWSNGEKMKMQLRDNFIKTDINSWTGRKRSIYTKIENISSVEIGEDRIWWLFITGFFTLLIYIGIIFIIFFFIFKTRWLVIYTDSIPLIVCYKDEKQAEQFRNLILQKMQNK